MNKRRTYWTLIIVTLFLLPTAFADPNNTGGLLATGTVSTVPDVTMNSPAK